MAHRFTTPKDKVSNYTDKISANEKLISHYRRFVESQSVVRKLKESWYILSQNKSKSFSVKEESRERDRRIVTHKNSRPPIKLR